MMKKYKTLAPVRSINGKSPARHIRENRGYKLLTEPCEISGVYFDETYLKSSKKLFKDKTFGKIYMVGYNIAWEMEEES